MSFLDWIRALIAQYRKKEEKPKPPPTVDPPTATKESGRYHGRFNGDRPTWYFSKNFSTYPKKFTLDVPGCYSGSIEHNGVRYEKGGVILKQSDVSGRGMALVLPSSCKGTKATIEF